MNIATKVEPLKRERVHRTNASCDSSLTAWLYVSARHLKDVAGLKQYEHLFRLCIDGYLFEAESRTELSGSEEQAFIKSLADAISDFKIRNGDSSADEAWRCWQVSIISEHLSFLQTLANDLEGEAGPFPILRMLKQVQTLLVSQQDAELIRNNAPVQIKGERSLQ